MSKALMILVFVLVWTGTVCAQSNRCHDPATGGWVTCDRENFSTLAPGAIGTIPSGIGARVAMACDFDEFRAASKAWAGVATESVYLDATDLSANYLDKTISREQLKRQLAPRLTAETRWRKAVEACAP